MENWKEAKLKMEKWLWNGHLGLLPLIPYWAVQVEPSLFYRTNVLLKTWFLSSWELCAGSPGCYWHCQDQCFLAPVKQANYYKTAIKTWKSQHQNLQVIFYFLLSSSVNKLIDNIGNNIPTSDIITSSSLNDLETWRNQVILE